MATTTAMAIVSRASRACDVCASISARWYCGADAAYLCDRCDTQVHTANALAQRHERVRLTPTGAPLKPLTRKPSTECSKPTATKKMKKKPSHKSPPQVLPARKRTRSNRRHPHRAPRAAAAEAQAEHEKADEGSSSLFADFFDTEDFLIDHPQEVPSIITDLPASPGSSYEYSPSPSPGSSSTCFSPESFHGASSPQDSSFAACFKGKAAQDDHAMSGDQFGVLVPEDDPVMSHELGFVPAGIDIICCDADGNISLANDACFIPGDIPGLDAFDDCGLGFDLALRGASDAFEGERPGTVAPKILAETDQYATGPFAKYFVTKSKAKKTATPAWSPEIIKSEAKEILRCCTEGEAEEQQRPTLRLNYEEIIAAWSDRGEPWVNPEGCCNAATDVGLVPDMGLPAEADGADHGSGGREARVSRYKEKRRSRLFSKTIRYEVRKLNAERRPRMKGRFVRRTNTGIS